MLVAFPGHGQAGQGMPHNFQLPKGDIGKVTSRSPIEPLTQEKACVPIKISLQSKATSRQLITYPRVPKGEIWKLTFQAMTELAS